MPSEQSINLTTDQIISLLNVIIPFASALILFYLASNKDRWISKTAVYRERLEHYSMSFT